jgi:hypothetical protein
MLRQQVRGKLDSGKSEERFNDLLLPSCHLSL